MKLHCIGSSSDGNCYLLTADRSGETLIIEAGMPWARVKRALGYRLGGVAGCIVSHAHSDHAGYLRDMLRSGITVLALPDVFKRRGAGGGPFCREVEPMRGYAVGGFKVRPVPVVHDVPCAAWLVDHPEMGRLFFITDTMMLEYRLPKGVNHLLLEANYADDILQRNIDRGAVLPSMRDRLMLSHMEFATARDIAIANDLSATAEIVLLHLSAQNSDAARFRRDMSRATGLPTYIAEPGLTLALPNPEMPY